MTSLLGAFRDGAQETKRWLPSQQRDHLFKNQRFMETTTLSFSEPVCCFTAKCELYFPTRQIRLTPPDSSLLPSVRQINTLRQVSLTPVMFKLTCRIESGESSSFGPQWWLQTVFRLIARESLSQFWARGLNVDTHVPTTVMWLKFLCLIDIVPD